MKSIEGPLGLGRKTKAGCGIFHLPCKSKEIAEFLRLTYSYIIELIKNQICKNNSEAKAASVNDVAVKT